jgi:hypothetical protein
MFPLKFQIFLFFFRFSLPFSFEFQKYFLSLPLHSAKDCKTYCSIALEITTQRKESNRIPERAEPQ